MTKEKALKIIEQYEYWESAIYSWPIGHPPCGKCTSSPTEKDYKEALELLYLED